jgi:hypothetical protein
VIKKWVSIGPPVIKLIGASFFDWGLALCAGTGSSGATIRMYVEQYVAPEAGAEKLEQDVKAALAPLVDVALTLSNMKHLTGRAEPTVIT